MLGTLLPILAVPSLDAASANEIIPPMVILLLCAAAAVGTILLLPSPRQAPKLGGVALTIAGLALALIVFRAYSGPSRSDIGPYFWIFSAIAIVGAIRVITHPRPVYSALYFVLTIFASAGLFILMYAEFMAAALVLIYAGAILITYVFVIMLASSAQTTGNAPMAGLAECDTISREPFSACCVGFALMGVLLFVIFDRSDQIPLAALPSSNAAMAEEQVHGSTQSIGQYLFQEQSVNLELAGLILTVAMVGAIMIARKRVANLDDNFEPSAEEITATATPVDDDPKSIPVYGTTNPKQKAFPQN